MSEREVSISVRNLIEFILREGSIDSGFMTSTRAVDGTRAHQKLQKINEKEFPKYQAEVYIKKRIPYKELNLLVEGRIDGVIDLEGRKIIEEIKSTTRDLSTIREDYNPLHWAQAKCYAYMYCEENGLTEISVMLRYFSLATEEVKSFTKDFTREELHDFFYDILDKYYLWAENSLKWSQERDASITEVSFPFPYYRKGQRELAVASYGTIKEGKRLFVQAPTGIGKTISTIFPSVKALGEGKASKIFYLTAKTITRSVAEEAFKRLKGEGLKLKVLTLTAKDKICFCAGEAGCTPEECPYAHGHFDRVNEALFEIVTKEDSFTRETIEDYAQKYRVCPFEFSLDLSLWADCIICDYNYAFDPRVYLKRFFDNPSKENYVFLIDEAHNLVDRAREMYSSELIKSDFLKLKKLMKGKAPGLYKALGDVNSEFIALRHYCEDMGEAFLILPEDPKEIYKPLRIFQREAEEYLAKSPGTEGYEELLDLFFKVNSFLNISELFDSHYVSYIDLADRDVRLKLFCMDPSQNLKQAMKRAKGEIIFSATLTPIDYFQDILGGDNQEDYRLKLPSPFPEDNIHISVAPISTRYKNREQTYEAVLNYIYTFISARKGNYLVFFPSYAYLKEIHRRFSESFNDIPLLVQKEDMKEEEREAFLNSFREDNPDTLVGFCVLGGIFSEGIDLTGDRLLGAVVVGVGLPRLNPERDILRDYFQKEKGRGYEFAYLYPGMNKVLQGVGRIIRTEKDRGAALLIDDRYLQGTYEKLMPMEWLPYNVVRNPKELKEDLMGFWDTKEA